MDGGVPAYKLIIEKKQKNVLQPHQDGKENRHMNGQLTS